MTTPVIRCCPICGSSNSKEIHRLSLELFEKHPLAQDCVTGVCLECGMAFNREVLPAESYDRYYSTMSKYVASTSAKAPVPRLPECAEMLEKLLSKEDFILDAGCGSGGVLAALKNKGFTKLAGIDPTPECVKKIRQELGLDARVGTLEHSSFLLGSFDVVISTVVFEHLLNPGEAVDQIYALLKPEGRAYVLVPDAARYAEFMSGPYQDVNVEHINHFSLLSLDNLFTSRGWGIVENGRETFTLSPTWRSTLIWGLYRKDTQAGRMVRTDPDLGAQLSAYFSKSASILSEITENLQADLRGDDSLIIWGAGHATSVLLAAGAFEGKHIVAIVDSNPAYRGQVLAGVTVGGHELRGQFSGPVVVATMREQDAVVAQIKSLGWANKAVCLRRGGA